MIAERVVAALAAGAMLPLALLWLFPLASDVWSLLVPSPSPKGAALEGRRPRFLILVPAHNEALSIASCARSLVSMQAERSEFEVHIVADNCTDRTADAARSAGAQVLERFDHTRRGKPWAIAWAMEQVPLQRFDAVVIVDADTTVAREFVDALAAGGDVSEKAQQGYFGSSNESDSWLATLGGLLSRMRYEGQYLHKQRAGLNCPLTGNGMCLGTAWLSRVEWPTESLTENWELYGRASALGERIEYAPAARLFSLESATLAQAGIQRRRWQAGRWLVLRHHWRRILTNRSVSWHQRLDAVGELGAPGPVLQGALAVPLGALLIIVGTRLGGTTAWFSIGVGMLLLLSMTPTLVWTVRTLGRVPDRGPVIRALLRLPGYALWRLAVLVGSFATGRRGEWKRSPRS